MGKFISEQVAASVECALKKISGYVEDPSRLFAALDALMAVVGIRLWGR